MAVMVWSEEAGAYITPEDILVRGEDGAYYSVPQINAVGTDGAWGQVWPEQLYLIRNGQVMPATGGYTAYQYMSDFNNPLSTKPVMPTATEGEGTFDITISRYSASFHGAGSIFFKNRIDLSKYKKIIIEQVTQEMTGGGWIASSVTSEIKNLYAESITHKGYNSSTAIIETSIDLNSAFFVGLEICRSTSGTTPFTYKICNIWLEP